jgi:diacylglycerol kinase family enzyme
MRWAVLVAGTAPDDLGEVCDAAHASTSTRWSGPEAIEELVAGNPDGLVVAGTDADLAIAAHVVYQRGTRTPLALIPSNRSDLLRMFGLDRDAILSRLQAGDRYPTDLGECEIGSTSIPFVAHVSAHRSGLRALSTDREVTIAIGERSHSLRSGLVVVANAQHFRGRTIAPRGAVMDGRLDFQSIGGSALRRARSMRRARTGHHLKDRNVWRRSAAGGEISLGAGWSVNTDSRRAGSGPFSVRVVPGAFDLWI